MTDLNPRESELVALGAPPRPRSPGCRTRRSKTSARSMERHKQAKKCCENVASSATGLSSRFVILGRPATARLPAP